VSGVVCCVRMGKGIREGKPLAPPRVWTAFGHSHVRGSARSHVVYIFSSLLFALSHLTPLLTPQTKHKQQATTRLGSTLKCAWWCLARCCMFSASVLALCFDHSPETLFRWAIRLHTRHDPPTPSPYVHTIPLHAYTGAAPSSSSSQRSGAALPASAPAHQPTSSRAVAPHHHQSND